MKSNQQLLRFCLFLACLILAISAANAAPSPARNLTQFVNPFLGTSPTTVGGETKRPFPFNTGNVFPGADTPQGMVQFSPDTTSNQAGGYWYPDKIIKDFSLTHFSGRGIPYEDDIGFLPVAGAMSAAGTFDFAKYRAGFSHTNEQATAGYYKVALDNGNAVELTATTHTGRMQATFPTGTNVGTMLVYLGSSVRGASNGEADLVGGRELTGFIDSITSGGQTYRLYFSAVFDRPVTAYGTWNGAALTPNSTTVSGGHAGAYLSFDTSANKVVHVNAGISYVSLANAQLNRQTEYPGRSFEDVKKAAHDAWNARLNRIQISDPNASQDNLTVFYTEMYRTLFHPNIFDDVNGQYLGLDKTIHTVPAGHHHYTHIEGWGGYRSASPFLAFLLPHVDSDIAQSLVDDAAQHGGVVGRWVQQNYDNKGNIGDGGTAILANAYAFGATDFDTASALKYMDGNASGSNGYREHGDQFRTLGWVAGDNGMSVEYALTDLAVAQFAQSLGRTDLHDKYLSSAQNWRHLFNPATLSISGRDAAGNWMRGYSYEGSDEQYNWLVPHNLRGLFDAMGGNAKVIPRLDAYFGWNPATQRYTKLNAGYGGTSGSGFGGDSLYDYAGDETCEDHPWMFLSAGAPWKTQKVVRDIETTLYTNTPGGMPGNDDGGELSSWYVFAALGIYPSLTGVGGFAVGSPLFADATVTTESGHVLHIVGKNAAPANPYVQSLKVNGAATEHLWLPISVILTHPATTLAFTLGPAPNTSWGTAAADAPPSFDVPKSL